ncbi:MAG: hypothetical protein ABR972_06545 [Acidimicrobiales bacterium]
MICRNATRAINHLAYRGALLPDVVVVTTVVEHYTNLLPWARGAFPRPRLTRDHGYVPRRPAEHAAHPVTAH